MRMSFRQFLNKKSKETTRSPVVADDDDQMSTTSTNVSKKPRKFRPMKTIKKLTRTFSGKKNADQDETESNLDPLQEVGEDVIEEESFPTVFDPPSSSQSDLPPTPDLDTIKIPSHHFEPINNPSLTRYPKSPEMDTSTDDPNVSNPTEANNDQELVEAVNSNSESTDPQQPEDIVNVEPAIEEEPAITDQSSQIDDLDNLDAAQNLPEPIPVSGAQSHQVPIDSPDLGEEQDIGFETNKEENSLEDLPTDPNSNVNPSNPSIAPDSIPPYLSTSGQITPAIPEPPLSKPLANNPAFLASCFFFLLVLLALILPFVLLRFFGKKKKPVRNGKKLPGMTECKDGFIRINGKLCNVRQRLEVL